MAAIEPEAGEVCPGAEQGMGDRIHRVVKFDAFTVDLDAARITRDGETIDVEPQVFDLIVLLCTNPGRVIGHDEIIAEVWHGRVVSDSAIATRINAARKALGDDGNAQRVIRTVRGKGFRFELDSVETRPGSADSRAVDGKDADHTIALSCTPHGYSILMATREGECRQDWREGLPSLLDDVSARHHGTHASAYLAVFQSAADAVRCAEELIAAVRNRCRELPPGDRWDVKVGIAGASDSYESAFVLAGRLGTVASPGAVCISDKIKDEISNTVDVDAVPIARDQLPGTVDAFHVTRIGDLSLDDVSGKRPPQTVNLHIPEPPEISIVVLPFEVLGEDRELDEVATGLRLEIQNALVQLAGVLPIAAGTAMAFAGDTSPRVADALGVRYVVQGNARAIGRRVRVMLELYDHSRGGVSWSHSFEGSFDEGFDFQDDVTKRVVTAIDVKVLSGEQARIWRKNLLSFKAIQLQYRGMRDFFKMSKDSMRVARESFERLHELSPEVSIGSTWVALCHWFELQRGWTDDPKRTRSEVTKWANIAVQMEITDGQAQTALCHVYLLEGKYDEALKLGESAITVRPSCANANGFYAHALYYCGLLDKAVYHAKLAIRFAPAYPPLFAVTLAGALHAQGDQEGAIPVAADMLRLVSKDIHARVILCSALVEADRLAEARSFADELKQIDSKINVNAFLKRLPFRENRMRRQLEDNFAAVLN
ncbi:MAG TPA: winged helix-turn-helix domain-containing protein [Gammaproteobacteria bacterium]